MDTNLYKLDISLTLEPRWHLDPPSVIVRYKNHIHWQGDLEKASLIPIQVLELSGSAWISVEMTNKKNSDTVLAQGLDKAVIVKNVGFNGISDPRFLWEAEYTPYYPPNIQNQNPKPILKSHDYLSWNGPWILKFDVPVFTWIHRVRNLGWIYP